MIRPSAIEPQFHRHVELKQQNGLASLGIEKNVNWYSDPKNLVFEKGVLIISMPMLQSQQYASRPNKVGHSNCKDAPDFKALMQRFFDLIFIFSMNDKVVHRGYFPMAQYPFALCTGTKK